MLFPTGKKPKKGEELPFCDVCGKQVGYLNDDDKDHGNFLFSVAIQSSRRLTKNGYYPMFTICEPCVVHLIQDGQNNGT